MPKITNRSKADPFRAYTDAAAKCRKLSCTALDQALVDERDAIQAITATNTIVQKLNVLGAVLKEVSGWTDGRDVRLLESIRHDVQALSGRAA